jgi:hypothetical protein
MASYDFKKRQYEEDTQCQCCLKYFRVLYYWNPETIIPAGEKRLYCKICKKSPGYDKCECYE